jgi:hypothetical protein
MNVSIGTSGTLAKEQGSFNLVLDDGAQRAFSKVLVHRALTGSKPRTVQTVKSYMSLVFFTFESIYNTETVTHIVAQVQSVWYRNREFHEVMFELFIEFSPNRTQSTSLLYNRHN